VELKAAEGDVRAPAKDREECSKGEDMLGMGGSA